MHHGFSPSTNIEEMTKNLQRDALWGKIMNWAWYAIVT